MEHLTSLLNYLDSRLETVESLTSYLDKLKGIPEREEMNRIVGEIFFLSRSIQQKKTEYEKEQAEIPPVTNALPPVDYGSSSKNKQKNQVIISYDQHKEELY